MTNTDEGVSLGSAKVSPFDPEDAGAECLFRFGDAGALLFWSYCLLSSEKRKDLAAWGQKLLKAGSKVDLTIRHKRKNKAGHPLPNLTKIDRGLASRWYRANPLPSLEYLPPSSGITDGLPPPPTSILLLPLFFCGEAEHPWQSHLLLIYDLQTRKLFHRFLALRSNVKLTADWILHSVAMALRKIAVAEDGTDFCIMPSVIQIPIPTDGSDPRLKPYSEAFDRLKTAILAGKECSITWLRDETLRINTARLDSISVAYPEIIDVVLDFTTAREFATVITRISHRFQNDEKSSWISLTPPKAIKRLDPNRFSNSKPRLAPPASNSV